MDIAHDAKHGVRIANATWLSHYDNYYRNRQHGLPLPVLRVQYDDANQASLYIDPVRGGVGWHEERASRLRRWLLTASTSSTCPTSGIGVPCGTWRS
jgi:hypothetical protein